MNSTIRHYRLIGTSLVVATLAASTLRADDLYAPAAFDEIKSRTLEWVAAKKVTEKNLLDDVATLWTTDADSPTPQMLFERVIGTFGLVDPQTGRFLDACSLLGAPLIPPDGTFLFDDGMDPHYSANLRLFYARYLTQRKMFDEALPIFNSLDPATVVDPASCLYFKAVCQHQLLMKKEGLATIELLLKNTEAVPVRYSTVARLMQHDLQAVQEKSLDEIARKMKDSERRLELARSGPKAQKVQEEIIAGLDAIIKKLEQQSGGGGGGNGMGGNSNQPGGGASDSSIKGNVAPGQVDKKKFRNQAGWGGLNPKEQARAKNEIRFKFPAHYQKQNDEYFKKLAKRRAQ